MLQGKSLSPGFNPHGFVNSTFAVFTTPLSPGAAPQNPELFVLCASFVKITRSFLSYLQKFLIEVFYHADLNAKNYG